MKIKSFYPMELARIVLSGPILLQTLKHARVVQTEATGNYKMKMEYAEKNAKISISLTQTLTILLAHNALLMTKIHGKLFVTSTVIARNAQLMNMQI
jgi:hypothetical protein